MKALIGAGTFLVHTRVCMCVCVCVCESVCVSLTLSSRVNETQQNCLDGDDIYTQIEAVQIYC